MKKTHNELSSLTQSVQTVDPKNFNKFGIQLSHYTEKRFVSRVHTSESFERQEKNVLSYLFYFSKEQIFPLKNNS